MLIQFNFKNYKSFRDETILDLSATRMTEFSDRVVAVGGDKLLRAAAIYGANASGKSNVYGAFSYMTNYVTDSFQFGNEDKSYRFKRPKPFLLDDETENAETTFEVYFTMPGDPHEKTYNYGFCIDNNGVSEEWLNTKAKSAREYKAIFYRNNETLDLEGFPAESKGNIIVALEKQALVVSLGAKLKIDICKQIRDWFLDNEMTDFANPYSSMRRYLPTGFVDDPSVREDVVEYLSAFDDSIKDFRIEPFPIQDDKDTYYKVSAVHKKTGSEALVEIPLEDESAGTLKMFSLYSDLQKVLRNGSVFFVDDLNARLHPLLVRNFILTFLNPKTNPRNAQLIFTIHDTWHLSNNLLRRDEVWFTEKNSKGVTTLYSLADFVTEDGTKIRKDEDYEKNYLIGKYGAIPSLKTIQFLEGE